MESKEDLPKSERINLLEKRIKKLKDKMDRMRVHIPEVLRYQYDGY